MKRRLDDTLILGAGCFGMGASGFVAVEPVMGVEYGALLGMLNGLLFAGFLYAISPRIRNLFRYESHLSTYKMK